jgi:hypothetical protein
MPVTTATNGKGECPRCGEWAMMTPLSVNALSRLSREPWDESIWICSDCGVDEALEQHFCTRVTPTAHWPIALRTFGGIVQQQKMAYAMFANEREEDNDSD